MCFLKKVTGSVLVLFVCPAILLGQIVETDQLDRGLQAEEESNYERALEIWLDARHEPGASDARLGFEFIRLSTEQSLESYYPDATEMYLWAISLTFQDDNREVIKEEIERLRPISGEGFYRQWRDWFKEGNRQLSSDIRGFWIQLDPTPGSEINERLIEHWTRIATSRESFLENELTVYGTDDRALTYIRYGEPDRKLTGLLTLDNQRIGRWLSRHFDTARRDHDHEFDDTSPRADQDVDEISDSNDNFGKLEEYVRIYHQNSRYEIWAYDSFRGDPERPLIFIYGEDILTGEFRNQGSIDDFIHPRAFLSELRGDDTRPDFVRQGLSPALALQMLYYEQLAEKDPYFSDRLRHIRNQFIDQGPLAFDSLDLTLKTRNREVLENRLSGVERQISYLDRVIPAIPIEVYQYRLIDEENSPIIVSFLETRPGRAMLEDLEFNRHSDGDLSDDTNNLPEYESELSTDYQLQHILLVFDELWDEAERHQQTPDISFLQGSSGNIIQSVIVSEHRGQRFQSAAGLLLNHNPESTSRYTSIFPDALRGLGTLKFQQPAPLETDAESLELGDLILGYRDTLPKGYPFDFRVANDQMIPADESLLIRFEVYNLQPRENGFTHFELTYRIYPVLEDGSLLTEEEAFYLTINFEDDQTRVTEDLEIQTTDLSSGLYELQVFIEDMVNGQERNRNIRFEVTN